MDRPHQPKKTGGFEKYEIDSAADSLIRAEEIRADSKLHPLAMRAVKAKAVAAERAASIRKKLAAAFPNPNRKETKGS